MQREVLTDIVTFGMPVSGARKLGLGERLVNLNRSLHSMTPPLHGAHKNLIAGLLRTQLAEANDGAQTVLASVAGGWRPGETFELLARMRELTLATTAWALFGDDENGADLARLLHIYFFMRREATSPANAGAERRAPSSSRARSALSDAGEAADAALRAAVRRIRRSGPRTGGLLARLAAAETADGDALSEDEIVGHLNILFVSSTEPIAVALTWTLLLLSQLPALRRAIRDERRTPLIDRVIRESLRLFPPNAFMVRVTTRPVILGGFALPANCEIVLCPFVSHRDGSVFHRPEMFDPDRWERLGELPFHYLPFGAGGHACVGKTLALRALASALGFVLAQYDLVLAGDQEIDWRSHIQFMPRTDPVVAVASADATSAHVPGVLRGPVSAMVRFAER